MMSCKGPILSHRLANIAFAAALSISLLACDETKPGDAPTPHTSKNDTITMKITTTAFAPGKTIPKQYTGEGQDVSPALSWSGAPAGVKQFVLICDDPDAPTPQPWVHWVIYNLSASVTALPEGLPRDPQLQSPVSATQGVNSWPSDNVGYRGPMPPPGHGVHHYHFKLYALDSELKLAPGLDKKAVLNAITGHVLAQAEVMGTYERR